MPHRERYLFVCVNRRPDDNPKGSCAQKGAEQIIQKLKEGLARRGLAKTVRACSSSCLDLCDFGVSVVLEPDHIAYGRVTLDDVDPIIDSISNGEVLERLVIYPENRRPMRDARDGRDGRDGREGES